MMTDAPASALKVIGRPDVPPDFALKPTYVPVLMITMSLAVTLSAECCNVSHGWVEEPVEESLPEGDT